MNKTHKSIKIKLSIMMGLQWAIFGAWLPLLLQHMEKLGFSVMQQTIIGTAPAAAAMLAIFFGNDWADRRFSAEKYLGVSHLIGGIALLGLFFTKSYPLFCVLMYVHAFFYMPTISITNAISFRHLKDPQKEFGHVRMWGPVGWMAASWPMYFLLKGTTGAQSDAMIASVFVVGGCAAILLGLFSFALPSTPVLSTGNSTTGTAWVKALKLTSSPFLIVLLIVALIDSINHMGYFILSGSFLESLGVKPELIMPIMGLSQLSEIFVTFALGYILTRLGWKMTLLTGIFAHALRFMAYALMAESLPVIIGVQLLHGVCYACFFATLYIFVDVVYPKEVSASAQGIFNFVILGLGDLFAKWLYIPAKAAMTTDGVTHYSTLFLLPMALSFVGILILGLFFTPPNELKDTSQLEVAA
ncbi:MAG: MFS transporter [Verrucomicrobiota bacterium]